MGPVDIRFVEGFDIYTTWPQLVRNAALNNRFAIIQDTYVPGQPDMVFDEPLWRALVRFMVDYVSDGVVTACRDLDSKPERLLDWFRADWEAEPADDRDPPEALLVRRGGRLVAAMITAPWCRVGGPKLYHDSWTYSIFTENPVGDQVRQHLMATNNEGRWSLAEEVVQVSLAKPVALTRMQQLFNLDWLRR